MEKKNIDWGNLGFGYVKTDYRYVSNYKDGKWDEGGLTTDDMVTISECAGVLQYAQTVFEGMKAYTTEDGHIVTFRPDLNGERMEHSAARLEMPVFPKDRFVDAVVQTIKANAAYVPPYGSGATLYVRPYMFGSDAVIGVKPASEYQFRVFTTPVGPYFKGGAKPITIRVSDFDRAAPNGTGHIKAGLNYAMSLHAIVDAHKNGFDENMYLDSKTRTKVEETGGANFLFVTKDGKVVTPKSDSILPSITRRSLIYVAKEYLGLEAEEREVYFDEVKDFAECGLCGTAAVISPVGKIVDHGKEICFPSGMNEMGPITKKLYETLTGIQMGRLFISLISHKLIFQIKICLLFALCCHMPLWIFIQIRKITVCNIGEIDLGHLSSIAIRKKLLIDSVAADAVYIFCRILFQFFHKLFNRMNDYGIFHLVILISGKNDVYAVFKRKPSWKTLQVLSSHNTNLASGLLTKHFHIRRNAYKKLIVFSNSPVFVSSYYYFHFL